METTLIKTVHLGGKDGELIVRFERDGNVRLEFEGRLLNILQPLKGWITIRQSSDMWDLIREGIIDYPFGAPGLNKYIKRCKLKIKEDDKSFVPKEVVS